MKAIKLLPFLIFFVFYSCKDYDNPLDDDNQLLTPSNLIYEFTNPNEITIQWKDLNANEEGFKLEISGEITKTITLPENSDKYILTDMTEGNYMIKVSAFIKSKFSIPCQISFSTKEDKPIFNNLLFSEKSYNSIKVHCTIKQNQIVIEKGICWSTDENPTIYDFKTTSDKDSQESQIKIIESLKPNTQYFFRAYLKSNGGLYYGETYSVIMYRESKERVVAWFNPQEYIQYESTIQMEGLNMSIDWGDGNYETFDNSTTIFNGPEIIHSYSSADKREVVFYGDKVMGLIFWESDGSIYLKNPCGIDSLDLSNAPSLTWLEVANCYLKTLDLTKNSNLAVLDVSYNYFTTLDLSKNKNLLNISCWGNHIDELDLSYNKKINGIDCGFNKMKKLNISGLSEILYLFASNNLFSEIDVSNLNLIYNLDLTFNSLKHLDLSKNINLEYVDLDDNLISTLNIENCSKLKKISCADNVIYQISFPKYLPKLISVDFTKNKISACTFNLFFNILPDGTDNSIIKITENQEAAISNTAIAKEKGWSVDIDGNGSALCH